MEKLEIRIREEKKDYCIFIGGGVLQKLADFLQKNHPGKKIAVVTDSTVNKLHKDKIIESIGKLNPFLILVPSGESSKSRKRKEEIEDELLENNFGRDAVIVAFGGGVIGDLVGFVAATFNRGIPFIQVPTTLLAMADSSIGGKTSVNTEHGKNLIGAFYHPDAVFADLKFLETLSDDEFKNGLAEIIKIAVAADKKLFDFLEENHKKILSRNKEALLHIINRGVELKKEIVEKDPKESGLRQTLNFGHTFGHALELYYNYKIKHGYAVAQGIIVESRISAMAKNLDESEEGKIRSLLKIFGFPLTVNMDVKAGKIMEFMASDKKSKNQKPRFVILERIGKIKSEKNQFSFEADEEIVSAAINSCRNEWDCKKNKFL